VRIYLDYNATAPAAPGVVDAVCRVLRDTPGNPSSIHAPGQQARAVLDADTRFFIASMYTTSGKDGVRFASGFYDLLLAGKTPFEAFYEIKNNNITAPDADYPDILRFLFFVNP